MSIKPVFWQESFLKVALTISDFRFSISLVTMTTTRGGAQNSVSRLIGSAKTLPVTDLATNRCVLQQMLLIRQEDS